MVRLQRCDSHVEVAAILGQRPGQIEKLAGDKIRERTNRPERSGGGNEHCADVPKPQTFKPADK